MDIILKTLIFSTVAFIVALTLSLLMGRKLISQITFFDFVVGVALGTAVVNAANVQQETMISGFTILITISLLKIIIDFAHIKSFKLRKLVEQEPVMLVEKGQIVNQNMKRLRVTTEELMMLLREKNYFNIANVEYAILETDGKLSVQPKGQSITRDIIIDGNIMGENLKYAGLTEEWLIDQLRKQNINDIKDVFYAGADSANNLYVSKLQKTTEEHGEHGIE